MRSSSLAFLALAGSLAGAMPSYFRRQSTSPDNTCGNTGAGNNNGYTCPTDLQCCSQYGYCGSTSGYCGDGCQAEFGTCEAGGGDGGGGGDDGGDDDTDRCGPDFNNKSCASNECCSASGWCGTSEDYCAAPDCLFLYGPACDANKVPGGTNTSSVARPLNGGVLYGGAGIYSCVNAGEVALTYDDGPGQYTSGLLDLLDQYDAKATFFVSGDVNSRGSVDDSSLPWPALLTRMHSAGHQIASHTWSHADLSAIGSGRRKDEMWKNEMALRNVLGFFPTYMRPPYSSCTAESGCEDDMRALGYHIVYFDLDTQDYLNTEPSQIGNALGFFDDYFVGKNPDDDSALAIAHDIHEQTATTLSEHMLEKIKQLGYTAVTVGQCLGDPEANWYRSA